MQVCQGLKIIMLSHMDNLGALLCDGAPVMFQDFWEDQQVAEELLQARAFYQK